MNWMGIDIPVQFFDYEADGKKFVIWGLPAHTLTRAAAVVYRGNHRLWNYQDPKAHP